MRIWVVFAILATVAVRAQGQQPRRGDPICSTQPAEYRSSGNLARVMVMRKSVQESSLADEQRQRVLELMDDVRDRVVALTDREKATPSEPQERIRAMQALRDEFGAKIKELLDAKTMQQLSHRMGRIELELGRIKEPEAALERMKKLELSEKQAADVKAALEEADGISRRADWSDGVPVGEKQTEVRLKARDKLRELMDEPQRAKWDEAISDELARRGPRPTVKRVAPVAPPAAK